MLTLGSHNKLKFQNSENFRMLLRLDALVNRLGSLTMQFAALLLAVGESSIQLAVTYLHRLVVALRETSGQRPFEPLSKTPRHVCLVIGRPSAVPEVDGAVKIILSAGVERVTVCHDGSLALAGEMYTECITSDMGKSLLLDSIRTGIAKDDGSQPDAVLLLPKSTCPSDFSLSAIQIPKCVDGSHLYYSELVPLYSLHPSDVFLAVSMFQSKSQRFGR